MPVPCWTVITDYSLSEPEHHPVIAGGGNLLCLFVFCLLFSAVDSCLADTQYFSYKNLTRETLTSTTSAVSVAQKHISSPADKTETASDPPTVSATAIGASQDDYRL